MDTTVRPGTDTPSPALSPLSPDATSDAYAPRAAVGAVAEVMREVTDADLDGMANAELLALLEGLDETARLLEACRARVRARRTAR